MVLIDNYGKDCEYCHRGRYVETSFFDDMDGTLHCDACHRIVTRYYEMTDKEKLEIVVDFLKKIVAPYTHEDDINCLDDVVTLAGKTLDKIGEKW